MRSRLALISLSLLCAATASALDFGNLVFIGDSITHGGAGAENGNYTPSYRYDLWKNLVDSGATYNFVGSQTGAYSNRSVSADTPTYQSQTFSNVHEGHYGWRASWESGSVAIPAGRYNTNNLGSGTLSNWLGTTSTYQVNSATDGSGTNSTLTYSGTTYTLDTAVILLGVNDLVSSGGTNRTAAEVLGDLQTMVTQLQAKNSAVRVYVSDILPTAGRTTAQNQAIADVNAGLAANAASWSTGTSTVSRVAAPTNFNTGTSTTQYDTTGGMTLDGTHPNLLGERQIANNFAYAMGLGPRTVGLIRRDGSAFATQVVTMNSLPGTTSGAALYRSGTTGAWTQGSGVISLASTSAAVLQSNWGLTAGQKWSVEAGVRMTANGNASNNFVIWADNGSGTNVGFLRIFETETVWGYTGTATGFQQVLDMNPNTDALHTFRLVFDGATYEVWRDGFLIGESLTGSTATAGNALKLGNFTSNTVNADVSYVSIDTTGAYASLTITAVPEPSTYGLIGAGALAAAFVRRRRKLAVVA